MHRTKVCAEEKLYTVLDILAGKESVYNGPLVKTTF